MDYCMYVYSCWEGRASEQRVLKGAREHSEHLLHGTQPGRARRGCTAPCALCPIPAPPWLLGHGCWLLCDMRVVMPAYRPPMLLQDTIKSLFPPICCAVRGVGASSHIHTVSTVPMSQHSCVHPAALAGCAATRHCVEMYLQASFHSYLHAMTVSVFYSYQRGPAFPTRLGAVRGLGFGALCVQCCDCN